MSTTSDRLFVDDAMADLLRCEERVASLESDVRVYRDLLSLALTELHSEKHLNRRLMWRLSQTRETRETERC